MTDITKNLIGKNFALSFALIFYVIVVGVTWSLCSISASVPLALPDCILYVGAFLVSAQSGVSITDKFKKSVG